MSFCSEWQDLSTHEIVFHPISKHRTFTRRSVWKQDETLSISTWEHFFISSLFSLGPSCTNAPFSLKFCYKISVFSLYDKLLFSVCVTILVCVTNLYFQSVWQTFIFSLCDKFSLCNKPLFSVCVTSLVSVTNLYFQSVTNFYFQSVTFLVCVTNFYFQSVWKV